MFVKIAETIKGCEGYTCEPFDALHHGAVIIIRIQHRHVPLGLHLHEVIGARFGVNVVEAVSAGRDQTLTPSLHDTSFSYTVAAAMCAMPESEGG